MKQFAKYFLILVGVIALWNTSIIKPIKLFTVFLHELGHATMAFIFGYGISGFNINLNESGYTLAHYNSWFSKFMIANGGYLGSVIFALLILTFKGTRFKKLVLGVLSLLLLFIAVRFSGFSFTLLFAALFTAFSLVVYMIQKDIVENWVLDIIGIAALSYAVYDTFVDTILLQVNLYFHIISGWKTYQPMTDAAQLADLTNIPALIWGIVWLLLSITAIYFVLFRTPRGARRSRRYN